MQTNQSVYILLQSCQEICSRSADSLEIISTDLLQNVCRIYADHLKNVCRPDHFEFVQVVMKKKLGMGYKTIF